MKYSDAEAIKAIRVASKVASQFPIGCRVKQVDSGKRGTVNGYAWGGQASDGVDSLSCLKVRFDGNKRNSEVHYTHFVRVAAT